MTKPKKKTSVPAVLPRPLTDEQAFIALIERAARDPKFDAEKFKMLMDARAADRAERSRAAYVSAMADVQARIDPVRRDASNPQTRSRYASYEALDRAIRPVYTDAGFSLSFSTENTDQTDVLEVSCRVMHRAGHTVFHQLPIPIVTKGPQGKEVMTLTHATMSAKTYGMRGLLTMIFNVALTDDDGNKAGGKNGAPISDDELWQLGELIKETKTDVKQFCAYMEVDALVNLPAREYQRAVDALNAKKQKQKEAAT